MMLPNSLVSLNHNQLKARLGTPVFSSILQSRLAGVTLTGAAVIQLGLVSLHIPSWPCPFLLVTGVPCPGCGLSRAIVALLQGDWQTSLTLHAYGPIFAVGIALIALTTILPHKLRVGVIERFEWVERRTGVTAILLIGLILYWLARLLLFPQAFINLIQGLYLI
jgi:hypothetical protein